MTLRSISHFMRSTMLATLLLSAYLAFQVSFSLAATITVDGTCTFADAVLAAETDTAAGSCPAGVGDDVITLNNDSPGANVLINGVSGAIRVRGGGNALTGNFSITINANNVTIENVSFANNLSPNPIINLMGTASDVTIRNNSFRNIAQAAVSSGGFHQNIRIVGNSVDTVTNSRAFVASGFNNSVIADNVIQNGSGPDPIDAAIFVTRSSNIQILGNFIEDSFRDGIWIHPSLPVNPVNGVTIAYNVITTSNLSGDPVRGAIRFTNEVAGPVDVFCNFLFENNAPGLLLEDTVNFTAPPMSFTYNATRNNLNVGLQVNDGAGDQSVSARMNFTDDSVFDPGSNVALDLPRGSEDEIRTNCLRRPSVTVVFTPDKYDNPGTSTLRYIIQRGTFPGDAGAGIPAVPSVDLPGLVMADSIAPSGLTINSIVSNSCGGTLNADGTTVELVDGVLPAAGSCQIELNVSGDPGTYNTGGAVALVLANTFIINNSDVSDVATLVIGDVAVVNPPPVAPPPGGGTTPVSATGLTILKTASPAFAQPGSRVIFTITVSNNTGAAVSNLQGSDTVPTVFTINSVSANVGSATRNGQAVSFSAGSLGAGQSMTVTIDTTVGERVSVPFVLVNQGCLTSPVQSCSLVSVSSVTALPATGETPADRDQQLEDAQAETNGD